MYDRSVSDAHNFCRNPDLRDDSPWCFVERNPPRTEPCFVCNSLKERPTGVLPDLDHGSPGGFFEGFRYNMERLRQKFVDFMKKMGEKMERITARILERFGFNVRNVE
ncbi:unnamed protein product [Didymodactylos carnosus]|nr:unnamed protein product [Didymodactylos carnosus]CAF3657984.1 unnamed protein product [Didymodactylos carnosus]